MSSTHATVLTLDEIRNCIKTYAKGYSSSLVYQRDTHFCQASAQPKWMRAILSRTIIGYLVQSSGEFQDSEASNLIRKNIEAKSHKIYDKLVNLYETLNGDDHRAILEEEEHLQIALSRCAYVYSLSDSQKWESITSDKRLKERYKASLLKITILSNEGKELAEKIKEILISRLGVSISRQCLPYNYSSGLAEHNVPEVLRSIDGIKLLTAAVIIALNYQNNSVNNRDNDENVDPLTKYIHGYLLRAGRDSGNITDKTEQTRISDQSDLTSEDTDDLLRALEQLAHDAEQKVIKSCISKLVAKLIEGTDIFSELGQVIDCCRRAKCEDNLRYAIKQLGHCERLTSDLAKFDEDIHLSILLALIPLEIALILMEIEDIKEQLRLCRARDMQESLITLIEIKHRELNEKNQESKQYLQELERLQQEGLSNDSVLSLHLPKRQDDNRVGS